MTVENVQATLETVLYELKKVIVGQERLLERLLIATLVGGHVLVEGPPGLAKTLALKTLATILNVHYQRIQFTPDLLPSDLTGTRIFHLESGEFTTEQGPVFTNFLLADEINRAPAKVQSALLECMEEHQVTIGKESLSVPAPFLVMATQNPLESDGTYPLPDAQMDRFLFKILLHSPSVTEELEILNRATTSERPIVQTLLNATQILELQQAMRAVYLDPKQAQLIVDFVHATRQHQKLRMGASPRGTLALANASRARALLLGRQYVLTEDVLALMEDCLRHRIILTYEARMEHLTPDDILRDIRIKQVSEHEFRHVL